MANKLLSAEPSSTFLSSTLMIGYPETICCPKLDHLGKKGGRIVLAVFLRPIQQWSRAPARCRNQGEMAFTSRPGL
jgi:hypothetical protein